MQKAQDWGKIPHLEGKSRKDYRTGKEFRVNDTVRLRKSRQGVAGA